MQTGPDTNPYAAPSEISDRGEQPLLGRHYQPLATLWQRWLGAFLDSMIMGVLVFIPALGLGFMKTEDTARTVYDFLPLALPALVVLGVQAMLVTQTGQTVGKKLVRTRIITADGGAPGFVRGVLLRTWLMSALGFIPVIGSVVGLVDALFVFRADRRTLHDLVAGTSVIQVL
jgi:uncharacterized RDD family membrane protein YckC